MANNQLRALALVAAALGALASGCTTLAQERVNETAPVMAAAPSAVEAWRLSKSDLPIDPDYRLGVLPNGMRYAIRANNTPAGTALVRMVVQTGSLDETDQQRGYAHFVEHMAFNGSTNVPEGEMVKLLEREGLAFGADTNASTGFEQTTYMLDLPRNDPALVDTALMLMRETAGNISFGADAVEREKGVVLSEQRDRQNFQLDNFVDGAAFQTPDAMYGKRLPIGTVESLRGATAEGLRGFYHNHYRPSNTTLIIVGDIDVTAVEARILARFADWQQPALPRPARVEGKVDIARGGLADVFTHPALSESVSLTSFSAWRDEVDTLAMRQRNLQRAVGFGIIARRMQKRVRDADPPFTAASFGTGDLFELAQSTSLSVGSTEGGWRRAVEAAGIELRRALQFGFSEAEVAEQLANIRAANQNAADAAATRSNSAHVGNLLALANDEQIPTTPQSSLERFIAYAPQITPDSVKASLEEEAASLRQPLIRFAGKTAPEGGEAALLAAWQQTLAAQIEDQRGSAQTAFAYTDFGPAGQVLSDSTRADLGIRQIRFANNVMLNLKRTTLDAEGIRLSLTVDGGSLLETREDPNATTLMGVFREGGLEAHSADELQTILAGRSVGGSLTAGPDRFAAAAVTRRRDLELQLQLLAAYLKAPGFRKEAEARYRNSLPDFFAGKDATPGAALGYQSEAIISDNDPRFTLGSIEAYSGLTMDALRQTVADRLANGALELTIVGDIDEAATIGVVGKTFGALPQREATFRPYAENRQRSFTARRGPVVIRHAGEANQAIVRLAWPTTDDSDELLDSQLTLLERVVAIRLTEELRERLGEAYSPSASSSTSRIYPGFGQFAVNASVDRDDLPAANAAMRAVVNAILEAPVDDDTIQRARKPILDQLDNALKTNAGWLALAARASSEPDRIGRFQRARARYEGITAAQLQAAAQRYLAGPPLELIVIHKDAPAAQAAP